MFHHALISWRDKTQRERAGSPLHLQAPAAQPGDSQRAAGAQAARPTSRFASASSAATAPTSTLNGPDDHSKAASTPAYRALLGHGRTPRGPSLPHVQPAGDAPSSSYSSLEGLKKLDCLHKGKHSTVHSYLDAQSGRMVAVKTYYKMTMAKRHYRNVRREIAISRLLAKQRFTGAVQLLGAFEDECHIYLVQESCAGGDLYRRMVRAGGTLPEADVGRDVVVPLLLTLTFLHSSHIVHRDIKPENIFFTADGGLRLGDFGLSIDARAERPTSRVGTLDYMAPEVVSMPSPDDMKRLGLAPHSIGHYGCKVDVWAVGILTFELVCGRPPFEVEDLKQTEQRIKFAEVSFPPHVSPQCRSFIQQALTKRPESRPSAAQLFQHAWAQAHYRQLLAGHSAAAHAAAAAAAIAAAHTPELRRTVSQPPSPSKSMPEGVLGGQGAGSAGGTPRAAALPPFLPLSQAKMAHKVCLLSAGDVPSSPVAMRRRRVSDPLARGPAVPATAEAAAEAAAVTAAAAEAPPSTPPPAAVPGCASDGLGAAAGVADMQEDAASSSSGEVPCFETPGTPGLKTTPLHRQRPVVQQRPLGRTPFLLPMGSAGGASSSTSGVASSSCPADLQPLGTLGLRKAAAPGRSRFAAAAENDELHAAVIASTLRQSVESLPSPHLQGRTSSLTSFGGGSSNGGGGSSGNLALQARPNSFTSLGGGGGSSGSLQLQPRASSFTSFGGSSSSNLTHMGSVALSSRHNSSKQLEGLEQGGGAAADCQQQQAAAAAAEELMQRLNLQEA